MQAIFIPHYPLFSALSANSIKTSTHAGALLTALATVGLANDLIVAVCFFIAAIFGLTGGFSRVQREGTGLLLSLGAFYAGLLNLDFMLYVVCPLNLAFMLWSAVTSTRMVVGALVGTRNMRVGEMFLYKGDTREPLAVPSTNPKRVPSGVR